jgi:hypothetical protein
MNRFPFNLRLLAINALAGVVAATLGAMVGRIASDSWRIQESLFLAALLSGALSVLYTWLAAKQKEMAKIIPIALVVLFALFVSGDFSDARGNPESMERFWNALPSYLGIFSTSVAMVWQTWAPVLRAWAKKGAPGSKPPVADATPPDPPAKAAAPKAKPRPKTRAPAPPPPADDEPTVDEPPPPEPAVRRPQITTELPKLKKR